MMKCFAVELQTNQYFGNKLVVDKVKCECQLLGTVCRVRLMQTFINKGQTPIQTAYIACLRNDISICELSSYNSTTNRHLSSKAVEKNTFDRGFSWMIRDEQLVKKVEKTFDCSSYGQLLTAQTGCINPGASLDVSLIYVTECCVKNNEIKFTPPKVIHGHEDDEPFHYDIDIDLLQPLDIFNIVSPTHDIGTQFANGAIRIIVDYKQPQNCGQDIMLEFESKQQPNHGHYPNILLCANGSDESTHAESQVGIMAVFPPLQSGKAKIARDLSMNWGRLTVNTQCPSPKHLASTIHSLNYTSVYAILDNENFPDGDIYLKGICNNKEIIIRPSYCVCTTLSLIEDVIHVMICNWLYREMTVMDISKMDHMFQLMTENNVLSPITKYIFQEDGYQMPVAHLQNITPNAVRESIGQDMKENNAQQKKRKLTPSTGLPGRTKVSSVPSFDRASFDNDDDAIIEEEEPEELQQDNVVKSSHSTPEITIQLQPVQQDNVIKSSQSTPEITIQLQPVENKTSQNNNNPKLRRRRPTPVPRYQQFSADHQRMSIIRMPSVSEDSE